MESLGSTLFFCILHSICRYAAFHRYLPIGKWCMVGKI